MKLTDSMVKALMYVFENPGAPKDEINMRAFASSRTVDSIEARGLVRFGTPNPKHEGGLWNRLGFAVTDAGRSLAEQMAADREAMQRRIREVLAK